MKQCWCGNVELNDFCEGYYYCKKCGSLVTKENHTVSTADFDDNADFYGRSYWTELMMTRAHTKNCSDLIDLYLGERAAYWLGCLYEYLLPGHGSVADIGCGMGQFTYLLKCSGYAETGFDLSPAICDYIRKELSINVVNSPFIKADKRYDAIVAMDLLEHLEDPVTFIQDVYSSLTEDGIILFQTPCFQDAMDYDTIVEKNPRFLSLMTPNEHLMLFSRRSIERLLTETGFQDICFLDAYFGNNYDMFVVASKQRLHKNTQEEIQTALYSQPYGRVLNALIQVASERTQLRKTVKNLSSERVTYQAREQNLLAQCNKLEDDQNWLMEHFDFIARKENLSQDGHPDLCTETPAEKDNFTNIHYSDGWIGKFYRENVSLDIRDDKLVILGKNLLLSDGDVEMTVYIDKKYAGCHSCTFGTFVISIPMDRPRNIAEISLVMNKSIVPASEGISEDTRELSVILTSIYGQNSRLDRET